MPDIDAPATPDPPAEPYVDPALTDPSLAEMTGRTYGPPPEEEVPSPPPPPEPTPFVDVYLMQARVGFGGHLDATPADILDGVPSKRDFFPYAECRLYPDFPRAELDFTLLGSACGGRQPDPDGSFDSFFQPFWDAAEPVWSR